MSDVPGGLFPVFCCSRPETKKVFQAASLLSDGLSSVPVFPHFLLGGEGKIAVIEEFVGSVLRFFITTDLPCHAVNLQGAVRV